MKFQLEEELGYLTAKVEHLERSLNEIREELKHLSKWSAKAMGFVAAVVFFTQILALFLKFGGKP